MEKILLLGGSFQQVVAIKKAKELGYYTVLCDYLKDNPGQYVADKYYNASTTDVEAVYKIAKEEKVSGILAYASDPAALPAAIVAQMLGLPSNPSSAVEVLGIKHKFRDFLQDNGFACPKHYAFSPNEDLQIIKEKIKDFDLPIIVKPTDSSGSKGVTKLENTQDLRRAINYAEGYSRNKVLIIEEFIQRGFPEVIGGDIFVWQGRIMLFGEMSCLRGEEGKGLVPIGEKKPSGLTEKQTENVHRELQRLVSSLGIGFGEMNIEIILDKQDNVHFLELGPRAGGNMIPIQLSDAFGVDLVKANVLAAMGKEPEIRIEKKEGCFMTYVLHSYKDGIFNKVEYSESIEKNIYRKVIYKQQGERVEAFDGAGKALGIVFLHFETYEQMINASKNMEKLIKISLSGCK
ncbi:MAG: ATP-grasp domain-containing protein [Bacteroidota bacterium]|nr:ATP-grasp domain-containing protein [Bacteroidota bacterium]